jgi:hypothetical protein
LEGHFIATYAAQRSFLAERKWVHEMHPSRSVAISVATLLNLALQTKTTMSNSDTKANKAPQARYSHLPSRWLLAATNEGNHTGHSATNE